MKTKSGLLLGAAVALVVGAGPVEAQARSDNHARQLRDIGRIIEQALRGTGRVRATRGSSVNVRISHGQNGKHGANGRNGDNGRGENGRNGGRGRDGRDGDDGAPGSRGASGHDDDHHGTGGGGKNGGRPKRK